MSSITCVNGCKQLKKSCLPCSLNMHSVSAAALSFCISILFQFSGCSQVKYIISYINKESNYYLQIKQQNSSSLSVLSKTHHRKMLHPLLEVSDLLLLYLSFG